VSAPRGPRVAALINPRPEKTGNAKSVGGPIPPETGKVRGKPKGNLATVSHRGLLRRSLACPAVVRGTDRAGRYMSSPRRRHWVGRTTRVRGTRTSPVRYRSMVRSFRNRRHPLL